MSKKFRGKDEVNWWKDGIPWNCCIAIAAAACNISPLFCCWAATFCCWETAAAIDDTIDVELFEAEDEWDEETPVTWVATANSATALAAMCSEEQPFRLCGWSLFSYKKIKENYFLFFFSLNRKFSS